MGVGDGGRVPLGNREGHPSPAFLVLLQKKKSVEGEAERVEETAGEEEESSTLMGEDEGEETGEDANEDTGEEQEDVPT